jgi:citrate lyase subunit beta/citryl-CoA lyase
MPELRRSYLFLPGADRAALAAGISSGADVLIQELEDFTPPRLLPEARRLTPEVLAGWRDARVLAAVRINPLDKGGDADLAAAMRGAPDIVALPKVAEPAQVVALDGAVTRLERDYSLPPGSTELLPKSSSRAA